MVGSAPFGLLRLLEAHVRSLGKKASTSLSEGDEKMLNVVGGPREVEKVRKLSAGLEWLRW